MVYGTQCTASRIFFEQRKIDDPHEVVFTCGDEVESTGHFLAHSVECRARQMIRCRHQQIQVTFRYAELSHGLR